LPIPARDFEGGAENLGTHEFRHDEGVARVFKPRSVGWRMRSGCWSGGGCEVGGLASLVGRMVWGWLGHSGVKANLDKLMFTADERNEF
jgi:hypothetical protein